MGTAIYGDAGRKPERRLRSGGPGAALRCLMENRACVRAMRGSPHANAVLAIVLSANVTTLATSCFCIWFPK
jgi:hypothetical protein